MSRAKKDELTELKSLVRRFLEVTTGVPLRAADLNCSPDECIDLLCALHNKSRVTPPKQLRTQKTDTQNARDQRPATADVPYRQTASRVRCIAWLCQAEEKTMRIWKWTLQVTDTQSVPMPEGAKVLGVQPQGDFPQLWALVDENAPVANRTFSTYGTGNPMPDGDPGRYVGTYQIHGGVLVFHVFEQA